MNNYNSFDLLLAVFFSMSPHIGVIGPRAKKLVTNFQHIYGETLPDFHLRAFQARSEFYLLNDKTGHKKSHK